jgi:hypothetical protein
MCDFFSLVSDGTGNIMYFDSVIRKQIIAGKLADGKGNAIKETDSHSSILAYNGIFGTDEDLYNKYEYNPLLREFKVDSINNKDDSGIVKEKCMNLDFKTIVPELQIKEIISPRNIQHGDTVNDTEIALLEMLASVGASVGASVWASVGASVWASVGASVRDSVGASVWASVWASVRDSVRDSVGDSVGDSVWAYISDFFTIANWKYVKHEPGKNPFQPCIDLWHLGLVPSFDGKTWRLHQMCNNAKVIYELVK